MKINPLQRIYSYKGFYANIVNLLTRRFSPTVVGGKMDGLQPK